MDETWGYYAKWNNSDRERQTLNDLRCMCPSPSPGVCSSSCPLSQWCHPSISASVAPLSFCLQSFPASGGQRTGPSAFASVLPMHIQDWFPLGFTDLISLLSKGLSRVFSSTTVWKHQTLTLSLLQGPTFTSIHDYWKNHSFDCRDLCQQTDVSTF